MTQKRFETVTVKMKSANTCTKLIHQKGIASVSICETMGFEIQTIYPPPKKKKKKNCLCIVFSFSWDGCNTWRNMKNKGYAKFLGANKLRYWRCATGVLRGPRKSFIGPYRLMHLVSGNPHFIQILGVTMHAMHSYTWLLSTCIT